MEHTPGPWETNDTGMDWRVEINAGGKFIAAAIKAPFLSEGEAQANARLIAAAPDLLEELDSIIRDHFVDMMPGRVKRVRALIASAKGE